MQAVELETKIENGTIAIPPQYQQTFSNSAQVKVILLMPKPSIFEEEMIANLLEHPLPSTSRISCPKPAQTSMTGDAVEPQNGFVDSKVWLYAFNRRQDEAKHQIAKTIVAESDLYH